LGCSNTQGRNIDDERKGMRAKMSHPSVMEEWVNIPTNGGGKGGGVGGDGKRDEEACMV